jgi:hypothetical protein
MDNIIQQSAPPAGTAAPGDLYIDLQSRQMWLGVDTTVASAGSVLISDIMAIQPAIDLSTTTAKSYTDTQVATRAPTVHTHLHTDITDFTNAVVNVINTQPGVKAWVTGMITMYSGSQANIGVGDLVGWTLCDGSNGAPDLRDKFIIGAGNLPNKTNYPAVAPKTDVQGGHQHTNAGVALSIAQMPSHNHTASLSGSGSGGTDTQGAHQHSLPLGGNTTGSGYATLDDGHASDPPTSVAGAHAHNVSVSVSVSGSTATTGSGSTHTHTMDTQGSHQHTITATDLKNGLPLFSLAFIMKL